MSIDDSIHALRKVNQQAAEMATAENECERGYAQLGWLIFEVAEMQYWKVQFNTFRDYLKSVSQVSRKTPAQLQQYFLTVRDLSDTFALHQLETMGITKAIKLRAAKDYALVLPPAVVDAALDTKVTVADLKKIISTALKMPEEEGDWMEFGFMVSAEERKTIEDAMYCAAHTGTLTKNTIAESAQQKEWVLKWCQEFLGTYPENAPQGDG